MLITVDFGSNMTKLCSKEYLLDFLFYSIIITDKMNIPNIKLELNSPTRDITRALCMAC